MQTLESTDEPDDSDLCDWDSFFEDYTEDEREEILGEKLQKEYEDWLRSSIDWSETEEDLYAN